MFNNLIFLCTSVKKKTRATETFLMMSLMSISPRSLRLALLNVLYFLSLLSIFYLSLIFSIINKPIPITSKYLYKQMIFSTSMSSLYPSCSKDGMMYCNLRLMGVCLIFTCLVIRAHPNETNIPDHLLNPLNVLIKSKLTRTLSLFYYNV